MATKTTTPSATSPLELVFQQWATMAELQLQFIEKLGAYKLATAQADLVHAVAASQWAVARMKATVARELQQSLARLGQLRYQTRRRQRHLMRRARDIAKIRDGERLSPSQLDKVWAAYTVFQRAVPPSTLEQLIATEVDAAAVEPDSYVDIRHPDQPCRRPPASVTNVHGLIQWLRRNRYVPRCGTIAYQQVMRAFYEIGSVATEQNRQLIETLRELEQRTYDTWKPVAIAGLPDTVDIKKITRIGG